MSRTDTPLEAVYLTPLYTQSQAASVVGTSPSSFQRWVRGYNSRSSWQQSLVTALDQTRGISVPFVGLSEALVVAAFRHQGLPMQRIRPAVAALKNGIGIEHALASERLMTDGVEILWDIEREEGLAPSDSDRLIVLRDGQMVFREVVLAYLRGIRYEAGFVHSFKVPKYKGIDVTVDPHINAGQPSVASRGVKVSDLIGRIRGGERVESVAGDYDLATAQVRALLKAAA